MKAIRRFWFKKASEEKRVFACFRQPDLASGDIHLGAGQVHAARHLADQIKVAVG